MSQHTWFEHFEEKLQGLMEIYSKSGTSLSLLGYALKEKHLTSEEYLQWAQSFYQLPRLQERFFTESPPSMEVYNKWATHYLWSSECLPVAEWDGALIVACLQPPQDFPNFPQSILVLTSYEVLAETWSRFKPERKKSAATTTPTAPTASATTSPAATEAPEGMQLSTIPSGKKNSDSFSFEDLGVKEHTGDIPHDLPLDIDKEGGLEGLFDNVQVTKLQALNPQEDAQAHTSAQPASVVDVAVAKASEKTVLAPKGTIPTAPVLPELSSSEDIVLDEVAVIEPDSNEVIPEVVAAAIPDVPVTPKIPAKAEAPPVMPVIPAAPEAPYSSTHSDNSAAPFEDSFISRPIPESNRPRTEAKATLNSVAHGAFTLEKLKKKNSTAFVEKVTKTLSEMKTHFDKSMILALDEEESQVTPLAWDENFHAAKDLTSVVPLKTPSIFNIVAATSKPFHGYVSLNEINEKFFEEWNQGNVPDHVTIAPIIMNDRLVGMLVGFAEKSAYNKASLSLAEKLSSHFAKSLQAA